MGVGSSISPPPPLPYPHPPTPPLCVQTGFCGASVFCTVTPQTISQRWGELGRAQRTLAAVGDIKFYSAGFIHSPGGEEREGKKKSRPRREKLFA